MALRHIGTSALRSLGFQQLGSTRSAASASAKWANEVRAASKAVTPDDPPTAPLHETHELYEGQSDFSNFLDRYSDVSMNQALGGMAFILGTCAAIYKVSTDQAKNSTPHFYRKESPGMERDIPTLKPVLDE